KRKNDSARMKGDRGSARIAKEKPFKAGGGSADGSRTPKFGQSKLPATNVPVAGRLFGITLRA
ncbi:MAG TPA: hypothetical protein VLA72_18470, partial [Anaerolineales bacterium]|nr:hypothetical protein [Anaerolineales bacterium]